MSTLPTYFSIAIGVAVLLVLASSSKAMAYLARFALIVGCIGIVFGTGAFGILCLALSPQYLVIAAILLGLGQRMGLKLGGWAYGTARWATGMDFLFIDAIGGPGFPVGVVKAPSSLRNLALIWTAPLWASEMVCRCFLGTGSMPVFIKRYVHCLVVGGSGRAKTQGFILPLLFTCGDSCIVLDPKGELAKLSASTRKRRFGHKIIILDPFGISGLKSDSLNPLEAIDRESITALDDCRALAQDMVERTGHEHDPHWVDSAVQILTGVVGFVIAVFEGPDRNLQTVATIIADPQKFRLAIRGMTETPIWNGMLARIGHQLSHFQDKELSSCITSVNRFLGVLNSPTMYSSTVKSTFDIADIIKPRHSSTFLILPQDKLKSHGGWNRLIIGTILRMIARRGVQRRDQIQFILEEAASLGANVESLQNALVQLRGFGVKLTFVYQSVNQISLAFPGQLQTVLANTDLQIYLGAGDTETAEMICSRIGETTVQTRSQNGGWNTGTTTDPQGGFNRSYGDSGGWSVQEHGRQLIKPEEMMLLDDRNAIVFAPNLPPAMTRIVRAYEPEFHAISHRPSNFGLLLRCFAFAAFGLAVASTPFIWNHYHQTSLVAQKGSQ